MTAQKFLQDVRQISRSDETHAHFAGEFGEAKAASREAGKASNKAHDYSDHTGEAKQKDGKEAWIKGSVDKHNEAAESQKKAAGLHIKLAQKLSDSGDHLEAGRRLATASKHMAQAGIHAGLAKSFPGYWNSQKD